MVVVEQLVVFLNVIAILKKILSFYQIPTDMKLRNMWLHWIGRGSFKPNKCDRVCSKHFVGGKKTCLHNVPTVVHKKFCCLHQQSPEQHLSV